MVLSHYICSLQSPDLFILFYSSGGGVDPALIDSNFSTCEMAPPDSSAMSSFPSPAALPLASKPPIIAATSASSPGPTTPGAGSLTSRDWVIPPRPKPGRKPAMDTPPTKRKAQNRAAQRAFRERRAARVGELEDQMKQIEDDNEACMTELREQVSILTREVEQSRREAASWRERCRALEKERDIAYEGSRRASGSSNNSGSDRTIIPLEQQSKSVRRPSMQASSKVGRQELTQGNNNNGATNSDGLDETEKDAVALGCSRCSLAHCQCIEDAFGGSPIVSSDHGEIDSHKIQELAEPEIKPEPEEMEVDFTSRFSGGKPQAGDSSAVSSPAVDPCGFCQDGTPCICAEVAAQEEQQHHHHQHHRRHWQPDHPGSDESPNRLAPLQNMSQFTPPPSESDVRSDVTLPPISHAANLCLNGPGTCEQCQADPRSTLFCKSLAALHATPAPSGCCGGNKSGKGGCCQDTRRASPPAAKSRDAHTLTLSCADAFTTLSRHPKFSRASDELETWIPKLHTRPHSVNADLHLRPNIEVEAASVMGVLRYFDRRFAEK